jgi:hypothetical protein
MKVIIYSVNLGGYDDFKTPKIIDPSVRYILFTDNKYFKSKVWEVYHTDFLGNDLDTRKKARFIKTNPHLVLPNHDINIWIDHCYTTRFNNVTKVFNEINFLNNNIMCYRHNVRNCIYKESEIIKLEKLDFHNVVDLQMNKYRNENFPPNYGLFDSGFILRKNNNEMKLFNETWWNEIKTQSGRDQLSQVYTSWKTKIPIIPISNGGDIYSNKYLNPKIKHTKKWSI